MTRSPCRDDAGTIPCPICQARFTPAGRQQYCSSACRKTACRRRHQPPAAPPAIPPARPKRHYTIYECTGCGQLLHGQQRCPDCQTFARRLGIGGPCPHCGEPVTLTDLLQEAVIMPGSR